MATALIIDDSKAHRAEVTRCIGDSTLFDRIIEAAEGRNGLKQLLEGKVDIVVCDLEVPGFNGEKLLQIKQASPTSRDIPILFITACENPDRRAALLEQGACDVLVKPFYGPDLLARLKLHLRTKRLHDELVVKTEMMKRLSTTDAVTGLRTRRYVNEVLSVEILRARRYGTRLSILMADLDHFKNVNDEYGHVAGDRVLAGVSELLLDRLRATDVAGRYGGEEILVVATHNDEDGASVLAERWRMAVEEARFDSTDGREIGVQISIGVAGFSLETESQDALVLLADEALYRAKDAGRNQVVVHRG